MGTAVNAHVLNPNNVIHNFFFDEKYMLKCIQTVSKTNREALPGSGYFSYLSTWEKCIYMYYNNVLEGLRTNGSFRCPYPISGVSPPVPNLLDIDGGGNWHYHTLDNFSAQFTGVGQHEVDEYCPVVRLNSLIKSQDEPDIHVFKDKKLYASDKNNTCQKIL